VPTEAVGERLTRRAAQFANRCDAVIAPSASLAQVLGTWGVSTPVEAVAHSSMAVCSTTCWRSSCSASVVSMGASEFAPAEFGVLTM
jgi:hypothetical protein